MDNTHKVRFHVEKADPNVIYSNPTTTNENQHPNTSNPNGKYYFFLQFNIEMQHMSFFLKPIIFCLLIFSVISSVSISRINFIFYVILSLVHTSLKILLNQIQQTTETFSHFSFLRLLIFLLNYLNFLFTAVVDDSLRCFISCCINKVVCGNINADKKN